MEAGGTWKPGKAGPDSPGEPAIPGLQAIVALRRLELQENALMLF